MSIFVVIARSVATWQSPGKILRYPRRGRRPRRPEIKSPLDATILLHCMHPVSTPANIKKTSALLDRGYNNVCVTYFHGERCDCCRWQIKGAERVAAVDGRRRCTVTEDIRRAPQQDASMRTAIGNRWTHIHLLT